VATKVVKMDRFTLLSSKNSYPVSNARKRRWIRFSIRDFAWIISTAASVSSSVIVQIGLQNMQMRAIMYVRDHAGKAVRRRRHREWKKGSMASVGTVQAHA
jgi:hypothetical protein